MSTSRDQKNNQSSFETLIDAFIENSESSVALAEKIISSDLPLNSRFRVESAAGKSYLVGLIHIAISNGNTTLLQLLLKNGADPDLIDSRLMNPLHQVIMEGSSVQIEMAQLLLKAGAYADSAMLDDERLRYPLHYLIIHSQWELANLLIPYCEPKPLSQALLLALEKNTPQSIETAKKIITLGTNIDAINIFSHRRPLHLATLNKQEEIVKLLLSHHADVNSQDGEENSSLLIAYNKQHWSLLYLLLTSGQKINQKDLDDLLTNIIYSNPKESIQFAPLLLKLGAKVNGSNRIKIPWHGAATTGNKEILVSLYKHGANFQIVNYQSKTAAQILVNSPLKYIDIYISILLQAKFYYRNKEILFWLIKGFYQEDAWYINRLPIEVFCFVLLEIMKNALDFYQDDLEKLPPKNNQKLSLINVAFFHYHRYKEQFEYAQKNTLAKATLQRDVFITIYDALDPSNKLETTFLNDLLSLNPIQFLECIAKHIKDNSKSNLETARMKTAFELMMKHSNNCNSSNFELVKAIYDFIKPKNLSYKLDFLSKKEKAEKIIIAIKASLTENAVFSPAPTLIKK